MRKLIPLVMLIRLRYLMDALRAGKTHLPPIASSIFSMRSMNSNGWYIAFSRCILEWTLVSLPIPLMHVDRQERLRTDPYILPRPMIHRCSSAPIRYRLIFRGLNKLKSKVILLNWKVGGILEVSTIKECWAIITLFFLQEKAESFGTIHHIRLPYCTMWRWHHGWIQ